MSKHHRHEECCYPYPVTGGYGIGYGTGYGGGGYGFGGAFGIKWFYALLILIVIVLQFGRRRERCLVQKAGICDEESVIDGRNLVDKCDDEIIDRSILFIIVVFLLVICAGCWGGGYGGGYGYN